VELNVGPTGGRRPRRRQRVGRWPHRAKGVCDFQLAAHDGARAPRPEGLWRLSMLCIERGGFKVVVVGVV